MCVAIFRHLTQFNLGFMALTGPGLSGISL